ncbi:MAG: AraC family transcriptional regulator [Denitrovibrio sp.]|nr:MAG: AraC family transcriptional regulator [Denitrovibrio sp.]
MSMSIEKMTKLPPVEVGYIKNPKLPIITFLLDVSNAGCAASHAHPRGQLIYASKGTMRVICDGERWIVPDSQAVWVPSYIEHEVYFPGEVTLSNLFVDSSFMSGLPDKCTVIQVSALLRELILKLSLTTDYDEDSETYRLVLVILDELKQAKVTDIYLPMATDERVMRVIEALMSDPSDKRGLAEWGIVAGASSRTLSRLFVSETGFTFGDWRKRLVLQEAIDRLGSGVDVTTVSIDLGYQSMSAFIQMFRSALGVSPGKYVNNSISNR